MIIYISNRRWYNNMVPHCSVISHEHIYIYIWWVLYFMFCASSFFIYLIRGIISAPTVLSVTPTDHTYETARSMWPRKKIINREPNYKIWRSPRFIFKLGFNPQLQRPINNLTYKRMFLFFYSLESTQNACVFALRPGRRLDWFSFYDHVILIQSTPWGHVVRKASLWVTPLKVRRRVSLGWMHIINPPTLIWTFVRTG